MEEYIKISIDDFFILWTKTFAIGGVINMCDICVCDTDLYLRLIAHGIPPTWYVSISSRNYQTGGFGYWVIWRKNKKSNGKNKGTF